MPDNIFTVLKYGLSHALKFGMSLDAQYFNIILWFIFKKHVIRFVDLISLIRSSR